MCQVHFRIPCSIHAKEYTEVFHIMLFNEFQVKNKIRNNFSFSFALESLCYHVSSTLLIPSKFVDTEIKIYVLQDDLNFTCPLFFSTISSFQYIFHYLFSPRNFKVFFHNVKVVNRLIILKKYQKEYK